LSTDNPEPVETEPTREAFEAARKRRNVMIAWMLVGFMVLVFSITALRFTQNMDARNANDAMPEVSDAPLDAE
jgi:predicted nucleic acid-binding Zn ribbon protein